MKERCGCERVGVLVARSGVRAGVGGGEETVLGAREV